jgi:tetratricopeptide (TPR) repeat protein
MIASGRQDYLTVSRRVRALRRFGEAQLKAGHLKDALITAQTALDAERPISVQESASGAPGNEEQRMLVHVLILAGSANAASGNIKQAEGLLTEAREKAFQIAQKRELTNAIPLAIAEQALGEFYSQQRRADEARACYQRLNEIWKSFSETNEYLEIQRAASNQLLASFR